MSRALGLAPLVALALVPPGSTAANDAEPAAAAALGLHSTHLAATMRQQALDALARDARLRQLRFVEATRPGYLFATTRVEQRSIEAGEWSAAELFDIGGTLFHLPLTTANGFGAADLPALGIVHRGRRGGPDARHCAACHWSGGPAGAGGGADNAFLDGDGDDTTTALVRNPIALQGAGVVELLAAEMSRELDEQRRAVVRQARRGGKRASVPLQAKGVSFGNLTALADGSLDLTEIEGIDADLVVKPFGWKGTFARVRDIVEDSLLIHHGMQTEHLELHGPTERAGDGRAPDRDGDGMTREITGGQLTALSLFVAMQPLPQIRYPLDPDVVSLWASGRNLFESIGCAACHVPSLELGRAIYSVGSDGKGRGFEVDLVRDGAMPRLPAAAGRGVSHRVFLFSDLKRHDLGDGLAEVKDDRGVDRRLFRTPPLWGLARSAPYLHDGRAPTIEDAILAHGGDAEAAGRRYGALGNEERAGIRVFLTSLTRARRMVSR